MTIDENFVSSFVSGVRKHNIKENLPYILTALRLSKEYNIMPDNIQRIKAYHKRNRFDTSKFRHWKTYSVQEKPEEGGI